MGIKALSDYDEDWDEDDGYDEGGYGEDDFDYEEYLEREFPEQSDSGGIYTDVKPIYRLTAVILLVVFVLGVLSLVF